MDLRVEKTYRSLTNEFMNLLSEKSFENITVAELCERAMIRRTTFYKHFADKNEFLIFFIKEMRDDFAESIENEQHTEGDVTENCIQMMRKTLDFLERHGDLVDSTLASQSVSLILNALGDVAYADISKQLLEGHPGLDTHDEDNARMLAQFLSGGITRMIQTWCYAGRADSMTEPMMNALASMRPIFDQDPSNDK